MEADESYHQRDLIQKLRKGEVILCEKSGRSKVWKVFAALQTRDGIELEYVYCTVCERVYKYNHAQTSNLIRHSCYMRKFSNAESDVSTVELEKSTIEIIEGTTNNLAKLFTKWIIRDCRPYDLIKNDDLTAIFCEILKLGSKFGDDEKVVGSVSRVSEISRNVSGIYEQCFESVTAEIATIKENGFGLTTDIWFDSFVGRSYVALTIHYLKNGVLTFRLLGLRSLEDKGIENTDIVEKVKQILEDFDCDLSTKSIIVTDGRGGIIADTQNLTCISHLLNYALLNSMKEVPEIAKIMSSCSKLVKFVKNMLPSTSLGGLLQTSNPNRWITIYKMLEMVENNWNEIEETLHNSKEFATISALNRLHLKAVIKTCQPFEEAIEDLEDDSHATLHLVIVYLHNLKKSCDTNCKEFNDFHFIEAFKQRIRFYLEKIAIENISILHKLALFLYPPASKLLRLSDNERKSVENECIRLMECFEKDIKPAIKQENPDLTCVSKRIKLFSDFVESEANLDRTELITQEIQYYKNTRVVNTTDFNVFTWWEMQKDNFPHLYKLSCIVLATPATSVAAKQVFSTASSLLTSKQDTDLEKIIFINSNVKHDELNI